MSYFYKISKRQQCSSTNYSNESYNETEKCFFFSILQFYILSIENQKCIFCTHNKDVESDEKACKRLIYFKYNMHTVSPSITCHSFDWFVVWQKNKNPFNWYIFMLFLCAVYNNNLMLWLSDRCKIIECII